MSAAGRDRIEPIPGGTVVCDKGGGANCPICSPDPDPEWVCPTGRAVVGAVMAVAGTYAANWLVTRAVWAWIRRGAPRGGAR